jgi:hypothetical protein
VALSTNVIHKNVKIALYAVSAIAIVWWIYVSAKEAMHATVPVEPRERVSSLDPEAGGVADKVQRNSKQLAFGNPLEKPPVGEQKRGVIRESPNGYYKDEGK